MTGHVRHRRKGMNHIAQGRGLDEKEVGHAAILGDLTLLG
jgi:hypothetical protein